MQCSFFGAPKSGLSFSFAPLPLICSKFSAAALTDTERLMPAMPGTGFAAHSATAAPAQLHRARRVKVCSVQVLTMTEKVSGSGASDADNATERSAGFALKGHCSNSRKKGVWGISGV